MKWFGAAVCRLLDQLISQPSCGWRPSFRKEDLAAEFLFHHGEDVERHDLLGRIAKPAHRRGPRYPQLYDQGELSGSADELFETVIIRTLVSEADIHAPIMVNPAKSSTQLRSNRSRSIK